MPITAWEWKMFPIPIEELLPSLLTFPIPTGKRFPSLLGNVCHPYWEMFPFLEMFATPTGKCFPSILGNISLPAGKRFPSLLVKVPNLSWERFPIWTGKHIPYGCDGKYFLILLGNVSHFHCLTWQFCHFFAIRVKPREFFKG